MIYLELCYYLDLGFLNLYKQEFNKYWHEKSMICIKKAASYDLILNNFGIGSLIVLLDEWY